MKYVSFLILFVCSCSINNNKKGLFNEYSYKNSFLNLKGISVDSINISSKKEILDILFSKNNTNLLDSLELKNDNYLTSKIYFVNTKSKKYSLVFFQDSDIYIRDNYKLIIKSNSEDKIYIIEDCLSNDLFRFGDFDNDDNLDYVEIDNQNSTLIFYSLKNGKKNELKELKLKLKSVHLKNISEELYYIK